MTDQLTSSDGDRVQQAAEAIAAVTHLPMLSALIDAASAVLALPGPSVDRQNSTPTIVATVYTLVWSSIDEAPKCASFGIQSDALREYTTWAKRTASEHSELIELLKIDLYSDGTATTSVAK